MRAVGMPSMPLGNFVSANCSRIPANSTNARPKPADVERAKTTLSSKFISFWITIMATPRIVQFVVISGKNTPSAWYSEGEIFLSIISTICTKAAITRMYDMV